MRYRSPHRLGCCRTDHPGIGRRELLQVGSLSLLGTGLADLLRLETHAQSSHTKARAKSVVFIFQSGGPSTQETFDPKPEAPDMIRGEYGVTQTKLPGINFCEYLPKLAARNDKFSIVRTMHHVAHPQFRNEHLSCMYLLHTGSTEMPAGDTNATIGQPREGRIEWPSFGSMIAYAAPPVGEPLRDSKSDASGPRAPQAGWPAVVEIPRVSLMNYPGRGAGLLGPKYEHWKVDLAPVCKAPDAAGSCPNCFSHDDPNDPERAAGKGPKAWWDNSSCRDASFHLPNLGVGGVSLPQIESRTELLARFDTLRRKLDVSDRAGRLEAWDEYRRQAMQLLITSRPGKQNPFDLTQEPDNIRDQYGREEWGQGFLVARRLIEAGVRMVQINLRGWDTHQNAFRDLKGKLLPSIDHCLSGFLDDLATRGLLDETLVVMCGEMGRTPRISPITPGGKNASGEIFTPGRHHWGDVFPCFFAGGGVRGGQVIGQTDAHAGLPISEAFTPSDLAATIFHLLGIDTNAEFHDSRDRPYRVFLGDPIRPLVG
ncbi:MAG: DUF1501 domain-containing protein [Planctomycetes bacterium]|nr:DUF1501 domain-containing protein [Planctomycetota bacterium]